MGDDAATWGMGVGSRGDASVTSCGIFVIDAATQSAINTLRNWRFRRQANGKEISREIILARILELWPGTADAEAARIVEGVLA